MAMKTQAQTQSSSRLHRLLTLLDTGSSQSTRFTAARQIGEIAKSYPQELAPLLKKVSQYLRSPSWETRVAAARAIGAIAENVRHISLQELLSFFKSKFSDSGISNTYNDLLALPDIHSNIAGISFRSFNINKVMEFGALMASGGQEYDVVSDSTANPKERLARQKQNLRRRLGLDVCEQFMDVNGMIRDEDLIMPSSHGNGVNQRIYVQNNIQRFVADMVPSVISRRPSPRERNLLKRKAKISLKDQTKGWPEDGDSRTPSVQNTTVLKDSCTDSSIKASININNGEYNSEHDRDGSWPFHSVVEQLLLDIFDPVWEIRHGSVMALREILTHQGASAEVFIPDMDLDGSPFQLEEDFEPHATKKEMDIDLNVQCPVEESEPSLKRAKLEEIDSSMILTSKDFNLDVSMKVEDGGCDSLSEPKNEVFNADPVPESTLFPSNELAETTKPLDNGCSSNPESSIMNNPPENSEVMSWIKLVRSSWLKNCQFLQDCAIRFLCILSLDRFGDYVSDQVVAPVRETCAQALGVLFKYMHPRLVHETLNILLAMQCRPEWEIRHGSLLGIKYLVAVRQEMLHELLGRILPACKAGLEDPDDDVRAVAADALIPMAASIVNLPGQSLNSIVMLLWDILLDLDDLSPSTSSVMNLLAEIYSQEEIIPKMLETLTLKGNQGIDLIEIDGVGNSGDGLNLLQNPFMMSTLAPRLWPFMRHAIISVRHSATRTLERLLEAGYKRSISGSSGFSFWPSFILGDTFRIVFQNLLLESNDEILQCSERVWRLLVQSPKEELDTVARSYMSSWIELASTPYGSVLDASKMFWPVALPRKSHFRAAAKMRAVNLENELYRNNGLLPANGAFLHEKFRDASTDPVKIVVGADVEMPVTQTRVVTSMALGNFASKLEERSIQYVVDPLTNALTSSSGVQRQVASMILISWFKHMKSEKACENQGTSPCFPDHLRSWLLDLLACVDPAFPTKNSVLPYQELSRTYSKMRGEASQLLHAMKVSGIFDQFLDATKVGMDTLSVDDAINLASRVPVPSNENIGSDSLSYLDDIESAKQRLLSTSGYLKCVQSNLHVSVSALVAGAVVWMSALPARLNPVILPLMASIRREQEEKLQEKAAEALAELIGYCISRKPSPNDKLIKNVCGSTCMDPCETPQASVIGSLENIDGQDLISFGTATSKPKSKVQMMAGGEDRSKIEGFISRRGSEFALRHLCEKFGASLFDKLPKLWDCLTEVLKPSGTESLTLIDKQIGEIIDTVNDPQILINNIQVVRSIAPVINEELKPKLLTLLPCLFYCVRHSHVAVRLASSRCITTMAKSMRVHAMGLIVENAINLLGDSASVSSRQGAGMLVSLLVQELGVELVSYAPLLVVPLLRCMGDCNQSVRQSVTHSFAALVPLLPLARGLPPPVGLSESFSRNSEDAKFLEQLLDNSNLEDYQICADLKVALRRYQQEGINWLAFLRRFKLHGILCDDMGLGKTLQASAIVACDIVENRNSNQALPPSLIICPSTLVGHWAFEIEKYIDASILSTLQYVGSAQERISLREQFRTYNVIITSYDVVRKDIDCLKDLFWNYCILDEGHIIKNAKSKITQAVKQLKAQNRLLLSGTPIQNNVMDLWSLFDFLMPGFLGNERQFQATYGKPLLAARDPKCSAKEAEAGALAMEALHKQVMPFLLRRTKDEVLSDLPEKIIQDRYCDLSPVQLKLYEQFSGSQAREEISSVVEHNDEPTDVGEKKNGSNSHKASSHVFQALQYLLKLCSHPLLILGENVPDSIASLLPSSIDAISELHKPCHSPKLVALQEILEECGIGLDACNSEASGSVVQHRVLIFAQHKAFLDIIERDLFHAHMRSVTYLRLDGSVEPEKRFDIVKAFNSDPTIDVLLLTTHVGGLGLNLTSADTLVFMEHDWNPMRDHQAMDRAHRLGQKKVVNVHRLIMRGTLEEKVMSLQKFKVSVANAVINAENSSMKTMNTDQLLDLFASAETSRKGTVAKQSDTDFDGVSKLPGGKKGLKAILGGLEELWDQSQYTEEYDLSQFLSKLSG